MQELKRNLMTEAFVYCWTDMATNKLYVGSHKGSDVDGYICSSKYMIEEYNKRPNDFVRKVIAHGTYKDILALETSILQSVNASSSNEFYNRHNNNGVYHAMGPKSMESRKKMRDRAIGRKRSAESKLKQSNSVSGNKNHFFGKTHSDDIKATMSKVKMVMYAGGGNPNAKSVIYNDVTYDTKKQMTEKTGISLYCINKMIETKEVVISR